MKTANEILGFFALAGPFWLLLILLVIGTGAALLVAKRIDKIKLRVPIAIAIATLVVVAPFADEIAGRFALSRLCEAEAGTKVYEVVALPKSFWDLQGAPRFIERNGSIDEAILPNYTAVVTNQRANQLFPIDKFRFAYQTTSGDKVLGEFIDFRFSGGWITRNLSIAPGGGSSCDLPRGRNAALSEKVFKPATEE